MKFFWLLALGAADGTVSGVVESDSALRILGLVSSVLGALGYTVSRGMVKQTQAQADAVVKVEGPKP